MKTRKFINFNFIHQNRLETGTSKTGNCRCETRLVAPHIPSQKPF